MADVMARGMAAGIGFGILVATGIGAQAVRSVITSLRMGFRMAVHP
jgi:hypothetical protein